MRSFNNNNNVHLLSAHQGTECSIHAEKEWKTHERRTNNLTNKLGDGFYYWAIQRSWFARVNALCNLSRKKSREVTAHFRADF